MEEKIQELKKALFILDEERIEISNNRKKLLDILSAKNIEAIRINAQIEVLEEVMKYEHSKV